MSYKCKGHDKTIDCPLKEECFRFTRESDKNQKYYDKLPYEENGGRCDFYLPHWVMKELNIIKNATSNNRNGKKGRKADQQQSP
jgi:hypothetical protein